MSGFTKLFASIVTSSLWCEDHVTVRVWIAMLATANKDGVVEGSVPGFAHLARVSTAELQAVLANLMAPDEWSRTKEHEGRRIEEVEGGWRILNYPKYRNARDLDERREYERDRKRRQRDVSRGVPSGLAHSAHAEAEAEAEAEAAAAADATAVVDSEDAPDAAAARAAELSRAVEWIRKSLPAIDVADEALLDAVRRRAAAMDPGALRGFVEDAASRSKRAKNPAGYFLAILNGGD